MSLVTVIAWPRIGRAAFHGVKKEAQLSSWVEDNPNIRLDLFGYYRPEKYQPYQGCSLDVNSENANDIKKAFCAFIDEIVALEVINGGKDDN